MIKRVVLWWSVALLGLLSGSPVQAQTTYPYPPTIEYKYCQAAGAACNVYRTDISEACAAWATSSTQSSGVSWQVVPPAVSPQQTVCFMRAADGASADRAAYQNYTCPRGGIWISEGSGSIGRCIADPNAPPPATACSDKNPFLRRWDYSGAGSTPPPSHYGGCVVTALELKVCRKEVSGQLYCMWVVQRTGEEYKGPPDAGGGAGSDVPDKPSLPPVNSPPIKPPAPSAPGANPCPAGTVHAGSAPDGAPLCIGQGSSPNNAPPPPPKIETSKTETLPDGSTKTTKTTVTTNADGSKTTDTETTITKPDGSKETNQDRTTGTNSAGQPGKMDTTQQDQNNLCKQNPTLSICRESSVNGTCGQITCVGDAIQCAQLRAAAAMQCEQQADKDALTASPSKALGDQVISGNDPMKGDIAAALKGTEVDLSKTTLDQGGFVGGGSCFADKSFTVVGKTVTVSFARVCQDIQPLRAAIMACAFIVAYLIVGRSVVQG